MGAILPPTYRGEILKLFFNDRHIPENAHAGLVFDRYLRIMIMEEGPEYRKAKNMAEELGRFVREFNERRKGQGLSVALLEEVNDRMNRLRNSSFERRTYRVQWRLVSGLGSYHPIENGFCFDSTVGVPIVAATGIKGLCRQAAELIEMPEEEIETFFGPEMSREEDRSGKQGDLLFLDAYPSSWPELKVDVVNCHHASYYAADRKTGPSERGSSNKNGLPVDWDDPVPVFFLTVGGGTEFVFRIGSVSRSKANVERGMDLLDQGLTLLGFGAKTSAGYGAMEKCLDDG